MVKVFRVEHENKRGCYTCISSVDEYTISDRHTYDIINHPVPLRDRLIGRTPKTEEICAFRSLTQAFNWFTSEELEILEKHGAKLKEIEVKQITAFGETQILVIR